MAPSLADSQHVQIRDMILSNCPPAEIAYDVDCSERAECAIESRAQKAILLQLHRRISGTRNFPEGEVQPQRSQPHSQATTDFIKNLPTLL